MSGWARTARTSSWSAATWSRMTWKPIQDASTPADSPMTARSSGSVLRVIAHRVCGMIRIRRTPSRWTPRTSASRPAAVTRPPGLRKILASPGERPSIPSGSIRLSIQVMMATPRWATPSKPPMVKRAAYDWLAARRSSKAWSSAVFMSDQSWAFGDGEGDRFGHRCEEVVALVVDDDEGREVLDLDLPDRLHAELGVLQHLDALDAVLRQPGCRAADRAEVEAAVCTARVGDLLAPVALGEHDHRAAGCLELVDVGVHPPGRRRAERAGGHAGRGLGRAGVVDRVVLQVCRHLLTRVEPLLDLRVGDVASDDQRTGERQSGLDGMLGELGEDLGHRSVEVDLDDPAATPGR